MAARDHISNPQFQLRVFHMSYGKQPPHTVTKHIATWEGNNVHPDVLHMGTESAARHTYRRYLHEYEIDSDVVDPVTHGDAKYVMDSRPKEFAEKMRNKQQELWETVSARPEDALKRNVVLPYRNYVEDSGSISYIVPKQLITQGKVRHVGTKDIQEGVREKLEKADAEYIKHGS